MVNWSNSPVVESLNGILPEIDYPDGMHFSGLGYDPIAEQVGEQVPYAVLHNNALKIQTVQTVLYSAMIDHQT